MGDSLVHGDVVACDNIGEWTHAAGHDTAYAGTDEGDEDISSEDRFLLALDELRSLSRRALCDVVALNDVIGEGMEVDLERAWLKIELAMTSLRRMSSLIEEVIDGDS